MSSFSLDDFRECSQCGELFSKVHSKCPHCNEAPKQEKQNTEYSDIDGGKFISIVVELSELKTMIGDINMAKVNCVICGNEFYVAPSHITNGWGKYCSMACRGIAYSGNGNPRFDETTKNRKCLNCGKEFRKKPSAIARGEGKYCSRECASEHRTVDCQCQYCGNDFVVPKSQYDIGNGKYCSQECYFAHIEKKDNCICIECGNSFHMKESDLNRIDKKGVGSFCSMNCKAKYMSSTPITTSGANRSTKGGKRDDLNGLYVRSGWEANYARYLNWLQSNNEIAKWEYEPDTFEFPIRRGSKFYTPDFKVWYSDTEYEYHEVKGYMDSKSNTKLKRFAKYYPDKKLILIDSDIYKSIVKKMRDIIDNWE